MNVLIVYAHPNPRSFNAAMRQAAVDALTEAGHAVQVSDLYAMNFKATLDEHDFKERQNPNFFDPSNEQYHAAMRGPSLMISQRKLRKLTGQISSFSNFLSGGSLSRRF